MLKLADTATLLQELTLLQDLPIQGLGRVENQEDVRTFPEQPELLAFQEEVVLLLRLAAW